METSPGPTLPSLLLETYHDLHPQTPSPDLTNKQATEYLTRLTGYSLNSLTSEPSRIADERAFVGRELTSLCIGEYKNFVAVHQCKEQVRGALDEFDASLEELRRVIPELERECTTFVQETSGIQSDRRRAQIVLEHQDKLVDLLDIPQLVDTCVRNGYYHEAMELTSHTRQLVLRHLDVPLVHSISAQVDSIMQLQLSQLVASLREPVKLPVLVKSIGFLRKMGSLDEDELRLAFLESRAQRWRDDIQEHVDKERHDATRYIRRYVDAFRELQYDTVAQYTAIFLDPSSFRSQTSFHASSNPTGLNETSRIRALDLIVRYAHHAVSDLLHCISTYIPSIADPSSLASLLTQLGYTALSFSRVGMDFSAYLPELFEHAVLELTVSSWDTGLKQVVNMLKPVSATQRTGSPSGRPDIDSVFIPGFLVTQEMLSSLTRPEPPAFTPPIHGHSDSKTVPPLYLTSYPPLATYTNSTLTTLNSLRQLAPIALFPNLYSSLLGNLATLAQALLDYANTATGQAESHAQPSRKRPEGLRRNTSISNRDQLAERTQAKERHGRRVLSALLDAFVNGCIGFLKTALVEGVYGGQFGSVQQLELSKRGIVAESDERLAAVIGLLKDWVSRHAERPAEKEVELRKGIKEEESSSRIATVAEQETGVEKANESSRVSGPAPIEEPRLEPSNTAENTANGHGIQPSTLENLENQEGQGKDSSQPEAHTYVSENEVLNDTPEEFNSTDGQPQTAPDISLPAGNATPATTEEATTDEQTSDPTPNVIEQVLEVALESSGVQPSIGTEAEGVANASVEAQVVPAQIIEDLQVPETDSAKSSLDHAKPIPIVPDTSIQEHSAKAIAAIATDVENGEIDIVDRLIEAKLAAEAAIQQAESTERPAQQLDEGTEVEQQSENAPHDTSIQPRDLEPRGSAEALDVSETSDMPSEVEPALGESPKPAQQVQGTRDDSDIPPANETIPLSTGADGVGETEGAAETRNESSETIDETAVAASQAAFASGVQDAASEELDTIVGGDATAITPSGAITPDDEVEDGEAEPTSVAPEQTNGTANENSGKSKKNKKKKKGKK